MLYQLYQVYRGIDWRFTDGKAVGKIEIDLEDWGYFDSAKDEIWNAIKGKL